MAIDTNVMRAIKTDKKSFEPTLEFGCKIPPTVLPASERPMIIAIIPVI